MTSHLFKSPFTTPFLSFAEMTEGDITRLNRMYACPQYQEEEGYDALDPEPTAAEDELMEEELGDLVVESPLAKLLSNEAGMKIKVGGKTKTTLKNNYEYLARTVVNHLKPLCKLKKKLKFFLNDINVKN